MDTQVLSRIQFAVTAGFHFLFLPLTIGLAWLLVVVEAAAWRSGKAVYDQTGHFFGGILGLSFVVVLATGLIMLFQCGTNWDRYSSFAGGILGTAFVAAAVPGLFLQAIFLGLYLFGHERISRGVRVLAIFMVALGASLSTFWIVVANSWMQTPRGYGIVEAPPSMPGRAQLDDSRTQTADGFTITAATPTAPRRAELSDLAAAVFNPSTMVRYHHTMAAAMLSGALFMVGCAAWILRKDAAHAVARLALRISLPLGLLFSVLVAFPSGHRHVQQVAGTQPEKFAAIAGLYRSPREPPLVSLARPADPGSRVNAGIAVPRFLSWLALGKVDTRLSDINAFPPHELPPLALTFVAFHAMVVLGLLVIAAMAYAVLLQLRGRLFERRRFLLVLIILAPLPLVASVLGWIAVEAGRQPWVIHKVMRTSAAFSSGISPGQALFSLILLGCICLSLLVVCLFGLIDRLQHPPGSAGIDCGGSP